MRSFRGMAVYFLIAGSFLFAPAAHTEEAFHCEVLKLAGEVKATDKEGAVKILAVGDLLEVGQTVVVPDEGYVDLAYDREWKNVSRIEANSKIKIVAIYPGKLTLESGSVFAKLKNLPKDTSFQVKTPTAVATVRGTEYRTLFKDGQTDVFNASASPIYVYGVNADGTVNKKDVVVLEESKKTSVDKAGAAPMAPQDMSGIEKDKTREILTTIEENIQEVKSSGRVSQIQSVMELEALGVPEGDKEETPKSQLLEPNESEESRVTDKRRRAFKAS